MDAVKEKEFQDHSEFVNEEGNQLAAAAITDLERKVLKKVDLWLLPISFILIIVAFLDRTAIGNARIMGMEDDLNMSGVDYNIALFIFFVPYIVLDIPSNIILKSVRPSWYLPSLMVCWGKRS